MSVGYDEALFVLGGDPGAIAASAAGWHAFASEASGAADALRGLNTEDFVGDEADQFRQVLDADLPHRLRTSSTAWGIVGTALRRFGGTLDDCQHQMRPLQIRAADAWQSVCHARTDAGSQLATQQAQLAAYGHSDAGSQPVPLPQPQPAPCPAEERLQDATGDLNALMDAALSVRARHDVARDACTAEIHRAAGMRFAEPPGWFSSLVSSVGGWIADHAAVLSGISAVLKQISSISGMLAMIPVLAPVMGPISVTTGATALAVDGAVMAATGKGSWSDLVLEGASMLPGAKAAVAVGTVQTAAAVKDAANGDGSWVDVFTTAASVAVGAKGARGKPTRRSGPEPEPATTHADTEPGAGTHDGQVDATATTADGAAPPSGTRPGYGDEIPPTTEAAPASTKGDADVDAPKSPEPTDPSEFPANLPHGTEHIYFAARDKIPPEWGPPIATSKSKQGKLGIRWFGPNPNSDGVRIDVGDPNARWPTQRVDHVIVRSNYDPLLPDGTPALGAIKDAWECHIPLSDWLQWREWNRP